MIYLIFIMTLNKIDIRNKIDIKLFSQVHSKVL